MLTTFDLDEYVFEALRAGAGGFMLKDAPPSQLTEGVRTVAAGESLLAPALTRRLSLRREHDPIDRRVASASRSPLGLSRQRVHQLVRERGFPAPAGFDDAS